jgi:hypothetical protein
MLPFAASFGRSGKRYHREVRRAPPARPRRAQPTGLFVLSGPSRRLAVKSRRRCRASGRRRRAYFARRRRGSQGQRRSASRCPFLRVSDPGRSACPNQVGCRRASLAPVRQQQQADPRDDGQIGELKMPVQAAETDAHEIGHGPSWSDRASADAAAATRARRRPLGRARWRRRATEHTIASRAVPARAGGSDAGSGPRRDSGGPGFAAS